MRRAIGIRQVLPALLLAASGVLGLASRPAAGRLMASSLVPSSVSVLAAVQGQGLFSLSEKDEIELGRMAAEQIEKDLLLVDDPLVLRYVDGLGQSLVRKSARPGIAYTFKVVNSPEINAFALPGGFIYVNRGLIEAADTEDELGGVLAHEIAHVVARHGAQQAVRAGWVQTGLGVLGGWLGKGTSADLSRMAAQMVAAGVFMKFSREAEREADRIGAQLLVATGRQPQAMVSLFEKLAALEKTRPNVVQRFFASHPSPAERAENLAALMTGVSSGAGRPAESATFREVKQRLAALPRPEVEAAKAAAAIAAEAKPPAEPSPEVRRRNLERDRQIAVHFAPVFQQALGSSPRFDYITNFDFDGDWRGDNNWENAADPRFALKAYVYYAVFETRTHYFVHYAAFHPRDYKGGEKRGALLSEAIRAGVSLGGQYDPTGRANEAVLAHENDLEGALVVAEKVGEDFMQARLVLVETLAHNNYLKYVPPGSPLPGEPLRVHGVRPHLFVEPKGHGISAWRDDAEQHRQAEQGFAVYIFTGEAEDPEKKREGAVNYDLLPLFDTMWPRARSGKNETYGEEHDYGVVSVKVARGDQDAPMHVRLGVMGSAFNGRVGAPNMARPPWGWFDAQERGRPLGEWFLQPAEVVRRHWKLPESFSTTYTYHPFLGLFR